MIFRRIRRQRLQAVTTRGVVFDDSPDFHGELLPDAGETFPSLAEQAAPRPYYVHRSIVDPFNLIDSLPAALDLQTFRKIRRKALAPALSRTFPRTYPRLFAGKSVGKLGTTHQRARASFAEFNRLRADPRTAMCVRRKQRRELLFAKRIAGFRRSPGRGGSYSRNLHSQWSC